ncbi:tRNA-dihydrouridine synthase [bacterium]|nr:tRNA-dihydrouridine synthase [bacterium]
MEIGRVRVKGKLVLAAMEEHTSLPFRLIAKELGAGLVYTEMVQPDRLVAGERLALRLLATEPREKPVGGQVLAGDEATTAKACSLVAEKGFDLVDVNLSCPIRRVLEKKWGGTYLSDPARAEALVRACAAAARPVPLTVKMRSGYSDEAPNAPELAARFEQAGAAAVILHGRSVERAYRGEADWKIIASAKARVKIPVVGAGSVRTPEDAKRMLDETGCDAVLVARGALGNPWIFARTARLLEEGRAPPPPSREERLRVLLRHLEAEARFLNARKPDQRLLRLAFYYAKDLPDFAAIQTAARGARSLPELSRALKEAFRGAR